MSTENKKSDNKFQYSAGKEVLKSKKISKALDILFILMLIALCMLLIN